MAHFTPTATLCNIFNTSISAIRRKHAGPVFAFTLLCVVVFLVQIGHPQAAEPPCDKYPAAKETLCRDIWKQLNDQAIADIAQFGLAQQQKREAGQITAAQHLAENMAFIKASTDLRLKKLDERMTAGK